MNNASETLRTKFLILLAIPAAIVLAPDAAHSQLLDPFDFSTLGTLNLSSGSFTIDTDALTIVDDATPGIPLFSGVSNDQNGQADYLNGVWVPGTSGIPEIAVFTFDDVNLQSSTNIAVIGTRALALLSQGSATIDTTLSVDGGDGPLVVGPPGAGGPGGFAGGEFNGEDGRGPGGGGAGTSGIGGSGGFGSEGHSGTTGTGGVIYGDLAGTLQGGSGGGGMFFVAGGGGGGALEIGVADILVIGPSGAVRSNGGAGGTAGSGWGGSGSGGGIRLHAPQVVIDGTVEARGGSVGNSSFGGGGRVLVTDSLPYVVGTIPTTAGIDVRGGLELGGQSIPDQGVVTVAPQVTVVLAGQSVQFGQFDVVQTASTTQPRIELILQRDFLIHAEANAMVGSTGYTNPHDVELKGGTISSSEPGTVLPLMNRGLIRGKGSIDTDIRVENMVGGNISVSVGEQLTLAAIANTNDGDISVVGGTLDTQDLANHAGGSINGIDATMTFPGDGVPTSSGGNNGDGLTNLGTLNLISATVNGDVHSPAGSQINVAGSVVFNGLVSGGVDFSGTSNLITFNGGYAPGDSPAEINIKGSLAFGAGNGLFIELGGTTPGSQHDQVNVAGSATLDGTLDVSLINAFVPTPGESFEIMTFASRGGEFASITGDVGLLDSVTFLLPLYSDTDLQLFTAIPGDGNLSGSVEAGDYTIWANEFGIGDEFTEGDFNGDGDVSAADYTIWANNFGMMASAPDASAPAAVPEPSAFVLAAIGLIGLCFSRRRGRSYRTTTSSDASPGLTAWPPVIGRDSVSIGA